MNKILFLFLFTFLALPCGAQLIITEFMYNPDMDDGEWIELYNNSGAPVQINGFYIGDSISLKPIDTSLVIPPGTYVVITNSFRVFDAFYGSLNIIKIESSVPLLNNTSDCIVIRDSDSVTIDSLHYDNDRFCGNRDVSIERLSLSAPSTDVSNWGCSGHAAGATPGTKNSLDRVYAAGFSLSPSKKIFSPDGDGYNDNLVLDYQGPAGAVLTIRVYDGKGRLVRDLLSAAAGLPGEPYAWDGKDNSGKTVPMGMYIIFAQQTVNDKRKVKKLGVVVAGRLK